MQGAVRFQPWRPQRETFDGLRLLLVGESHYDEGRPCPPEEEAGFTAAVVRDWTVAATGPQPFFVKTFQTVTGRAAGWSDPAFAAFWNSVFFYNYVQTFMPGFAGDSRPAAADYEASHEAFHTVLADIRPDAVLVLGAQVWTHMSSRGASLFADDADGLGRIWRYQAGAARPLAAHTRHPSGSRGFSPAKWAPRVGRFLDLARRERGLQSPAG